MKKITCLTAALLLALLISCTKDTSKKEGLPEGEKITINNDYYFTYNFNQKPSMGTVIMKIQVFDMNGKQTVPFQIFGEYGMPSMRGAHDSGMIDFKLNNKNDYLLPVDVAMPGDWDVQIIIKDKDKEIFKGTVAFDV